MREDKSSRRLAETSLTGGRQVLDAGVFSARRLEDRITPARFVEGLSGLIRCTASLASAACRISKRAARSQAD
jgi:hypothetical protein